MLSRVVRQGYLGVRNVIMERSGLQPKGVYRYSSSGLRPAGIQANKIPLPNLSGELRPILREYIDLHGLGKNCLLVSENYAVRDKMKEFYPEVDFVVTDLHTQLMSEVNDSGIDHNWDVCSPPPSGLVGKKFDSIISQSLLEHVIAPTVALSNFFGLLSDKGRLFLSTHTPSFHYHAYPRDYVRFHHDYFFDIPSYVEKTLGVRPELKEVYSHQGVICVCYSKS